MNRRTMPFILMLVAGAFSCVVTYIKEYSIIDKLMNLSVVLLVFYLLGVFIRSVLDYFDKQNEKAREEAEKQKEEEQKEQEEKEQKKDADEGEKEVR